MFTKISSFVLLLVLAIGGLQTNSIYAAYGSNEQVLGATDSNKYSLKCSNGLSSDKKVPSILDPISGVNFVQLNFKNEIPTDCILDFYTVTTNKVNGVIPEGESIINLQTDYSKATTDKLDILARFKVNNDTINKYKEIKAYYFTSGSTKATSATVTKISESNGVSILETLAPGYSQIALVGVGKPATTESSNKNNFWFILIASILGFLFLTLVVLLMRKKRNDIYEN